MTPEQLTGKVATHLIEIRTVYQSILVNVQVKNDLSALIEAAAMAGFQMEIASGFRDYQRQKRIWDNKFSGKSTLLSREGLPLDYHKLSEDERLTAILRWSALPGASRHHWGTDFDVYAKNHLPNNEALKLEPWEYFSGHQAEFYRWLIKNAADFGFSFPYGKDQGGVSVEPWHISHTFSSEQIMAQLTINIIKASLLQTPILGGHIVLEKLDTIYEQYITNINRE